MNKEGLTLLAAIIMRDASLQAEVKKGDCKLIAAALNTWLPADMQIAAVDVFCALKDTPGFTLPAHNAEVLRARIDKIPTLFAARVNCALKGKPGIGAMQTIVNELNATPDPGEHVTLADVEAAMDLVVIARPGNVVTGAATMVGAAG